MHSDHERASLAAVIVVLRREAKALKHDPNASNTVRPMLRALADDLVEYLAAIPRLAE